MTPKERAGYGEWCSPVSAVDTISDAVSFSEVWFDRGSLYWIEGRPSERGRQVVVRRDPAGVVADVVSSQVNVRTRVHEYGGGSMVVVDGAVIYSDHTDQRLYRVEPGSDPKPLTAVPAVSGSVRFADGRSFPDGRLVYVRETHVDGEEPVNDLVIVDPNSGAESVVASGADFYANPRPSPDGSKLAWVEWDHPNMPWDDTRLMVSDLTANLPPRMVAGGEEESVLQPVWLSDGDLLYVSDRSGWWNLYRWDGEQSKAVLEMEAEFAGPQWVFGKPSYLPLSDGRIVVTLVENGLTKFGIVADGHLDVWDLGFTNYSYLASDGERRVWFVGHRADGSLALSEFDIESGTTTEVKANPPLVSLGYQAQPETISFQSGNGHAHAIFYPPTNGDFEGPPGELPPLLVRIHGGPTSQAFPFLDPKFAFWTSRGIGVVDVNYRGSTGFGRAYRNSLRGAWGIADVEDAVAAAEYLVGRGMADPNRLLISGGSAGGFTVLACLALTSTFAAGGCYYGVADLNLLNAHTHKFEARYLDRLVGPDPDVLLERSPLSHVDGIDVPVILFQGLRDRVVPPQQSELIVAALERNGIEHQYITYSDEDHGFRDAANIVHSLESELAFYGRVLGFSPCQIVDQV